MTSFKYFAFVGIVDTETKQTVVKEDNVMSSVPLMALRNSERRSEEALDSDQMSDEEDDPLEGVLARMKYRYGDQFLC